MPLPESSNAGNEPRLETLYEPYRLKFLAVVEQGLKSEIAYLKTSRVEQILEWAANMKVTSTAETLRERLREVFTVLREMLNRNAPVSFLELEKMRCALENGRSYGIDDLPSKTSNSCNQPVAYSVETGLQIYELFPTRKIPEGISI